MELAESVRLSERFVPILWNVLNEITFGLLLTCKHSIGGVLPIDSHFAASGPLKLNYSIL